VGEGSNVSFTARGKDGVGQEMPTAYSEENAVSGQGRGGLRENPRNAKAVKREA
jgi:hypothetical protein